ncbi:MAG TPA: hypothetical protein VG738_14240 [Chitinophagaceae bacterium]|nr:hypothetical protein [Chitinophagaceae bacterium]
MRNNKDLSYINTLEDLQAMQVLVKLRIKEREKDLAERLHKLPQETLKAAVGAVVPSFLDNKVTGIAISVLRASLGLIFKRKSSRSAVKENIFSSAKKLGLFAVLRAGYNLWKNKS